MNMFNVNKCFFQKAFNGFSQKHHLSCTLKYFSYILNTSAILKNTLVILKFMACIGHTKSLVEEISFI